MGGPLRTHAKFCCDRHLTVTHGLTMATLLNAEGQLELTMGAYLIRTGDRLILVDAGVGMINNGQYQGGGLLTSLLELGVEPSDITDVILTHLHFDHVGWATQQGAIVFPNATYRCHSADWQHFIESDTADDLSLIHI